MSSHSLWRCPHVYLKNVCVNLLSSKTATLHQSQPRVLSRVFLSVGGSSTIRGCSATTRLPGVSSEEELASGCVSTSITHLWLQLNRDLFQEPHRGLHLSIDLISSSSCQPIWVVSCLPLPLYHYYHYIYSFKIKDDILLWSHPCQHYHQCYHLGADSMCAPPPMRTILPRQLAA